MTLLPAVSDSTTQTELDRTLVNIKEKELARQAKQEAKRRGLNFVQLVHKPIPLNALSSLPEDEARGNQAIIYYKEHNLIKLACLDPDSAGIKEIVKKLTEKYNRRIEIAVATAKDLEDALKEYQYTKTQSFDESISINESAIQSMSEEIEDLRELADKVHHKSLSEFLNLLFAAGLKSNASDIHLQPEQKFVQVRFRIDGVLHNIFDLETDEFSKIKKRIKLIAKLKINVEDKPQDGSLSIKMPDNQIDLRISVLPSNYGESIVIRILNPQSVKLNFTELGFREDQIRVLEEEINKPNGLIISCGPTGSGKNTTLYTILLQLNTAETQIITLENPIEYKLPGVMQTQVDSNDQKFAQGLRAILRQDPDVIMVGEIRDLETAETAINAALTGHLVVSTIHANGAIGAIPRFLAMGVKPFLLAPALNMIIGQRLVRRLCEHCKEPLKISAKLLEKIKEELKTAPVDLDNLTFYQSKGCKYCQGLSYKGRVGIYEILKIDDKLTEVIQKEEAAEYRIAELARKQGMITMMQDGLLKALKGITTVEEVFRVTT
ncbi:MAG: GspE/PulE family protein [Candidatus Jacksonbacteria bacterium]